MTLILFSRLEAHARGGPVNFGPYIDFIVGEGYSSSCMADNMADDKHPTHKLLLKCRCATDGTRTSFDHLDFSLWKRCIYSGRLSSVCWMDGWIDLSKMNEDHAGLHDHA